MEGGGDAEALRLEGNDLFKAGKNEAAVAKYSEGLKLAPAGDTTLKLHKNLAACYIKLEKWDKAIVSCDAALNLAPTDVKALFRRAQAHEKKDNVEKAFQDAAQAARLDKNNKAAVALAHSLMQRVSSKRDYKMSTAGIGKDIVDNAINGETLAKRKQAAENVAAFVQDEAGAEDIYKKGVTRLVPLLADPEPSIVHPTLHAFGAIASNSARRAGAVLVALSAPEAEGTLMRHIQSKTAKTSRAAIMVLSCMLESLSADAEAPAPIKLAIDKILEYLIALVPTNKISAEARDSAIAALVKNLSRGDVAKRFVDRGGVKALLIAASCAKSPLAIVKEEEEAAAAAAAGTEEPKAADGGEADAAPSVGIQMSKEARMQVAVALSHTWSATVTKKGKENIPYQPLVDACLGSVSFSKDAKMNMPAAHMLIAILQGVGELGNKILDNTPNIVKRLLDMAQSDSLDVQCIAAEVLAHAASDKKRATGPMAVGFSVLKQLYAKDLPDAIRVRALAGLCKMGSHGGGAANKKTFADGATVNLAKKIKPFLTGSGKSLDCRKWASEGLAYLSLDADVKELIVGDKKVLKVIKALCIDGDPTVQYGLANLLVNVTNAMEKKEDSEISSEEEEALKKIGKFAGEHIPEPHALDAEEYTAKRCEILVKADICTAMVHLAKTQSERAREQVARVFLALCTKPEYRGQIIQQGGAKALVPLANDNTDKGKLCAAQALAKLAITADPNLAFPGQRSLELVRPLLALANSRKGLHMFEASMALTNLASVSEDLRMRVVRENGIKVLEDMMFDDDWMIRRSATECLCNLLYCEKVFEMFATKEGKCWERLKFWILLSGCADDDFGTARAASGGLALLSASPDVCVRITEEKQGMLILKENAASGNPEMQMRALHTMRNMANAGKEIAEILVEEKGLELLSALHMTLKDPKLKEYVDDILEKLCEHKIIKSVNQAHKKGLAMAEASQTVDSFKKKVEEELEDEDEDEETEEVCWQDRRDVEESGVRHKPEVAPVPNANPVELKEDEEEGHNDNDDGPKIEEIEDDEPKIQEIEDEPAVANPAATTAPSKDDDDYIEINEVDGYDLPPVD